PRNLAQAEALDELLEELDRPLSVVFEFLISDEECIRRLMKRAELEGRADDTPETIAKRLQIYHEQTERLIQHYLATGKVVGSPAALCNSPNTMAAHGSPNGSKAREAGIASIALGVTLDGFVADSAFTFPVRDIDPEAQKLLDAAQEAMAAGIEQARPGNRLSD